VKKGFIIADFTELEVMEAIMEMKKSKAPGPDGSPAEFYQVFWDTIKDNMMATFYQLQAGNLPRFKLNFGIINLLPKKEDASHIEEYRLILPPQRELQIFYQSWGKQNHWDGPENHKAHPNCLHSWS
jgi:hypothetical protein